MGLKILGWFCLLPAMGAIVLVVYSILKDGHWREALIGFGLALIVMIMFIIGMNLI